jgi:hypothetical protein
MPGCYGEAVRTMCVPLVKLLRLAGRQCSTKMQQPRRVASDLERPDPQYAVLRIVCLDATPAYHACESVNPSRISM